jgi:dTDP-4-amino-4,6-dideoxygalactose transaminase
MLTARARYRIYGGLANYGRALRDLLLGAHRSDAEVPAFEAELVARFGTEHAVLAPLARVAIHDLVAVMVPRGHAVLMSPYTIVDVVNMVVAAGAVPVFVDVDPATGNMDPSALGRTLALLAPGVRPALVLVTHLHGVTADMAGILDVAGRAGLPVVEDAAQSVGAVIDGRRSGTLGHAGVYSLGSYKNVNAHFGGVIVTRDRALTERLREVRAARPLFPVRHLLRKLRESASTDLLAVHPVWGALVFPVFRQAFLRDWEPLNRVLRIELDTALRASVPDYMLGRFTDLQVRAARAQLPDLDAHARHRVALARRYHDGLAGVPGLRLPPPPDGLRHVYTYYALQVEGGVHAVRARRHDLLRHLAWRWRDVAAQHLHDVSALPDFRRFGGDCPEASRVAGAVVLLPTYPGYDDAQVDANVAAVRGWEIQSGEPASNQMRDATSERA